MEKTTAINDFLRKKKLLIWTSRVLIAFCFMLTFMGLPDVHADYDNKLQIQWVKDIATGVLPVVVDTIEGGGSSGYNSFYTHVTSHSGAMKTVLVSLILIGGAFCIVVAFSHFMQHLERGGDMIEAIWKFLLEFCIAMFFVMNTQRLVEIMDDVGQTILGVTTSGITEATTMDDAAAEQVLVKLTGKAKGATLWQITTIVKLFLPWALTWLVMIAAKFVILSLIFEMGIRYALTPLFIADIYHEGLRSPGMRHLKQYLAVYIKLLVCVLVCTLGQELILAAITGLGSADATSVVNAMFEIVAINFTCIGVMMKGGEYVSAFTG